MIRLVIEVPDDEIELLIALLPKFNARLISRSNSTDYEFSTENIIEPTVLYDGRFFCEEYELSEERFIELSEKYSSAIYKNNKDVGNVAIEIVRDFLSHKFQNAEVQKGIDGADLKLTVGTSVELLEVKGTTASTISWPTIKVSSKDCHASLEKGMLLVRVIKADTRFPKLYFLRQSRDFIMRPEPRWSVHPVKSVLPGE